MTTISDLDRYSDEILSLLKNGKDIPSHDFLKYIPIPIGLAQLLLNQLEADNYIIRIGDNHRRITARGIEFISKGGYAQYRSEKEKKEKVIFNSYKWTKIGVWVSVVLGLLNLIYLLFHDFYIQ